ncbi:MAG: hypothetical protein ABR985_04980 [Methanotrichaceae archaeon]
MTDEVVEVQAAQPSAMDRFWLETARSVSKESIGALEDAAKQLISITSLTQGIYFAAISFSDLKKTLVVHDWQRMVIGVSIRQPHRPLAGQPCLCRARLLARDLQDQSSVARPGARDASGYHGLQAKTAKACPQGTAARLRAADR